MDYFGLDKGTSAVLFCVTDKAHQDRQNVEIVNGHGEAFTRPQSLHHIKQGPVKHTHREHFRLRLIYPQRGVLNSLHLFNQWSVAHLNTEQ